ncbi:MAG: hypothetical protein V3T99_03565 [Nitrososphaerales archaeon]
MISSFTASRTDSTVTAHEGAFSDSLVHTPISQYQSPDILRFIDVGSFWDNPATFISIVSLLIAIAAIILPILRSWVRENNRLKSLEEYIYYILEDLSDPISKKLKNLRELSETIRDIENRNFGYAESSLLLTRTFNEISKQDLYEIFLAGKKLKQEDQRKYLKDVVDAVDFFDRENDIDKRNFFQFMSDLRKYEKQFSENANAIVGLFDSYVAQNQRLGKKPSEDEFLKGFDRILFEWKKDEKFNTMTKTKEEMLNPLKDLCVKNRSDERAVELLPHIKKSNYAFADLKNLRGLYQKTFSEAHSELAKRKNSLDSALSFFKQDKN